MQLRTRRNLFYAFCLAFLILGTGTVLYAQGWRFDFGTWRTAKVGGIFVQSRPRDAAIALDGASVRNTAWFLQSGTFINNLFPRTYTLTLHKEGFLPWRRRITVAPSLVSEVSNAVLVPHAASAGAYAPNTAPLDFSPAPLRIATTTRWSARLLTPERNGGGQARARDARASSTVLFLDMRNSTSNAASSTLTLDSPAAALAWNRNDVLGVLTRDGALLVHNPASGGTRAIADGVTHFAWNADGRRIAALEPRSLEIFDLEDESGYRRLNIPGIGGALRLIWYRDGENLFIVYPSKTAFLDFEDADLENIIEVVPTSKVAYDAEANTLYYREGETVKALEFPR
ncbi:MAG: hypothetical protein HYZ07_01370 [Candidatus Harrisonbacteria bacterium]|nr:hypothetical protein [Candidatus Harrisonbacteria bacterium]